MSERRKLESALLDAANRAGDLRSTLEEAAFQLRSCPCGDEEIDIVFDGPPGPTSGRFVEVENMLGQSVSVGEWIKRCDGLYALRLRVVR